MNDIAGRPSHEHPLSCADHRWPQDEAGLLGLLGCLIKPQASRPPGAGSVDHRRWDTDKKLMLFPQNYSEPELRQITSPECDVLQQSVSGGDVTVRFSCSGRASRDVLFRRSLWLSSLPDQTRPDQTRPDQTRR
ncbi:hypothetical protein [Thalassococcus sp. S3]|uniref:hypothetical protein n=1 Tax=Thalassococcus sp. S3 TaxID=2017482 RepID=UPI00102C9228|nr:hypothetical protein [Thalassococcus sp. S3]